MLVFIDESGDAGLKIGLGSSLYFVVTMIVFEDDESALAADRRIDQLRCELKMRPDFEFHFNKMGRKLRQAFIDAIAGHGFFYFSIVINKSKLSGPGFKFKESFYKYACGLVFENAKPHLDQATVIIDGSGSREFRRQLGVYLRKRINKKGSDNRYIHKVKVQDSHKNNLIQMADVVCGAVARSFGEKEDAKTYRSLLSHREIYVQLWPK